MILILMTAIGLAVPSAKPSADAPESARVVAVYDGDTFTLSTGQKVRLRGVNTPELRPKEAFGLEARDAAAAVMLNKKARLYYGAVKMDGYGRLIGSLQVDNVDIAEHLLENGLGHVFLIPPDDIESNRLLKAQARAKQSRRGIWSHKRYQGNLHITSFHANSPGNDNKNINGEYLRVCNISLETVNLKGYSITDISGRRYPFPDIDIPAGHTVKLHSGKGRHQKDPKKQLAVYLGSSRPIWNNDHDRATIYSPDNKVEDFRKHAPKSRRKSRYR